MNLKWTETERHIHVASVYRSEAETRRNSQPGFARLLDSWAENASRRAIAESNQKQPDLFA